MSSSPKDKRWVVPFSDIDYGPEEKSAVADVLDSKWLTMGPKTAEFEQKFATMLGAGHAVATSSGTTALHLAILAMGAGPGDEVIVPSLTFVASANCIAYCGATPVFADITGTDDLNVSPLDIEAKISARTVGIVVVHYGGFSVDMRSVMDIAARHKLWVVEDCAHAPGVKTDLGYLGTIGDVGCFSFFSNKNLVTGEGGMLVTGKDSIAQKTRMLRSHGMTTLSWDRAKGHAYTYDVIDIGYNYRPTEIEASLGLVQLDKLAAGTAHRTKLAGFYREKLRDARGIEVPFSAYRGDAGHHILPIMLSAEIDRPAFIEYLQSKGIQVSIHYPPIHLFSAYQRKFGNIELPVTEDAAGRVVTLPMFTGMTFDQVELVAQVVSEA